MKQLTRDEMKKIIGGGNQVVFYCCECEPVGDWSNASHCADNGVYLDGGEIAKCVAICANQTV
ncbi:MAG: hypothetical protein J0I09_10085 [Sphingobacteriia bacterium]|nr:hypothetical protein [Sphingobacteriia bacterium]